jgi:hypothetical protein
MMREKNKLKDRQGGTQHAKAIEEDSDYGSSSDNSDESESDLKAKAIAEIQAEISESEESND